MKGLIFTYGMCYGGAVVSLFNPFAGLLIYICFAIVKPEQLWPWSVPQGNYSRTVAIALLIGWALKGFGSWRLGQAWFVIVGLVGYFFCAILSALQAPNQEVAWMFVDAIFKIVLPCIVGISLVHSVQQIKQIAWVIVLSIGYLAFTENEKYLMGELYDRDNLLAHMMVVGAGVGLFLGLQAQGWWRKLIAFGLTGLMVHAVLFHGSRGGMVGLLVIGVLALFFVQRNLKSYLSLALLLALGLSFAGKQVQERFSTIFASAKERDSSAQSRLDLWRDMLDATKRRPVLGAGPSHWPLLAAGYGWPPGKQGHGLWLQLSAELGVPGALGLLIYYGVCVMKLLPYARGTRVVPDPWLRGLAQMSIASLLAFMVEAQFGSFSTMEAPYYVGLLGAATLKLLSLRDDRDAEEIEPLVSSIAGDHLAENPAASLLGEPFWNRT
ncbi:MAG TPA: O-antigen ligase family protein [Gemmataceae bacterium]|jgi:O-antigen ligase